MVAKMQQFLKISFLLIGVLLMQLVTAQTPLTRIISVQAEEQRLDHVLEIISNKGNFYFSYNSNLIKKDSLVSLSVTDRTVREILIQIFGTNYEFRESGQYIIIRRAPIKVLIVTKPVERQDKFYWVSGNVYDEISGIALYNASVYEKSLLAAALTNQDGYFKLRLKHLRNRKAELTVSKEFYEDTTVIIETSRDQQLSITLMPFETTANTTIISPDDYMVAEPERDSLPSMELVPATIKNDSAIVERTGLGRFLLSAKQKAQSLNIKKFFTTRPFQVSLIPGISTQGKLGSQVVNNVSVNALGGYTAGTNGAEVGGLFNINQKDTRYFQAAGLFNVVGGELTGMQSSGVVNLVLRNVTGFQSAGVGNYTGGKVTGAQAAGVYNHVADSMNGFQAAGVANFVRKNIAGVQVAGVINIAARDMNGVQIAGVFNYTKRLRGVQIGLINIADTSDGYSIGLINIVLKGYHKLALSANELMLLNASFKTGNRKLYSILMAGMNPENDRKLYAFGYGLGSELYLNKKHSLSLNPEISSQYLYRGSWNYTNILNRLQLNLAIHISRHLAIYGGPAFSVFTSDQETGIDGYQFDLPRKGSVHSFSKRTTGWIGWNAGIHLF